MLLMDEEILRSEICHSINRYATANDKYIKDYGKMKNCHISNSWM